MPREVPRITNQSGTGSWVELFNPGGLVETHRTVAIGFDTSQRQLVELKRCISTGIISGIGWDQNARQD
jgi:hypothetical protein